MASLLYKLGIKEYTDRFKTWIQNAIENRISQEHIYFKYEVGENLVYYKGPTTEGEYLPLQPWVLNMTLCKPITPHMVVVDEPAADGKVQVVSSNKFEVAVNKLYDFILTWVYNDLKYTLHFEGEPGAYQQVITSEPYVSTEDLQESKVDKVEGLGLSQENFTTEDKEKLDGLENYDDTELKEEIAETYATKEYVNEAVGNAGGGGGGVSKEYVDTKVTELSAEVGKKQDTITDLETIRSGAAKGATALQSVPDTYATKTYVDNAIKEIPQGGGGGGMTTPSGDPMHYMFEAVGAEWNGTGADIERQGVYGDTITHKAGYWYLNELGDITNEEMRAIYAYWMKVLQSNCYHSSSLRTNIQFITDDMASVYATKNGLTTPFYNSRLEVIAWVKNEQSKSNYDWSSVFAYCGRLQKVIGAILAPSTNTSQSAFLGATVLRYINIKSLRGSIDMRPCSLLSNASVLYMIQNEAAPSAIVITLHADAYARAEADAEIQSALEAHPNVSLAK